MVTCGSICSNHISEVLPGPMRNFIICEYSPGAGRYLSKQGYILLPPLSKSPTGKRNAVAIASSVSTRGLEDPDSSLDNAPFETPDNLDRSFNETPVTAAIVLFYYRYLMTTQQIYRVLNQPLLRPSPSVVFSYE